MSDVKISQLPAAEALTGEELIPLIQNGETRKSPVSTISAVQPAGLQPQPVTYAELTGLIAGSQLVPGRQYLLTDFRTRYYMMVIANVTEAPVEPLLLTAATTSQLDGRAVSTLYPRHRIEYFPGASDNLHYYADRGYISFREDSMGNSAGFDFVGCKQRFYAVNKSQIPLFVSGNNYVLGNVTKNASGNVFVFVAGSNNTNLVTWEQINPALVNVPAWDEYGWFMGGSTHITFMPVDTGNYLDRCIFSKADGSDGFDSPDLQNCRVHSNDGSNFGLIINCKNIDVRIAYSSRANRHSTKG